MTEINEISEAQKQELERAKDKVVKSTETLYEIPVDCKSYFSITGIELGTLQRLYSAIEITGSIFYEKAENGVIIQWITRTNSFVNDSLSGKVHADSDFLELFKEKATDVNYDSVVKWLRENRSEIASVLSDADVELMELPDCLVEEVKDDAVTNWFDNADSDDIYDKVPSGEERELAIKIIENL